MATVDFERFAVKVPNAATAETMSKTESGQDVYKAEDAEDLLKQGI